MTLTIELENLDAYQWLLKSLKKRNVPYQILEKDTDSDAEVSNVQNRLHDKYVVSGEWEKMDDEDRQDAVLAETMIWRKEQPNYEVFSAENTAQFLADLKKEIYAHTGQ